MYLTINERETVVELIRDRLVQLAAFDLLLRTTDEEKRSYAMEARTLVDALAKLAPEDIDEDATCWLRGCTCRGAEEHR